MADKNRWVKQAQRNHMTLSDYVSFCCNAMLDDDLKRSGFNANNRKTVNIREKFLSRRQNSIVIISKEIEFDAAFNEVEKLVLGKRESNYLIKHTDIFIYCFSELDDIDGGYNGDCYLVGNVSETTQKIANGIAAKKPFQLFNAHID